VPGRRREKGGGRENTFLSRFRDEPFSPSSMIRWCLRIIYQVRLGREMRDSEVERKIESKTEKKRTRFFVTRVKKTTLKRQPRIYINFRPNLFLFSDERKLTRTISFPSL